MLLNASINSNKTDLLVGEYVNLLQQGVSSDEIIFLALNATKKEKIISKITNQSPLISSEKIKVQTFYGLAHKTIGDFSVVLQGLLKTPDTKPINLIGLELSQYLFKKVTEQEKFAGYNSKKSLLHQLFRRNSLIIQNDLSGEEVDARSKVLKEAFSQDAKNALKKFSQIANQHLAFDYLKQLSIFNYLYKNHDCFSKVKYLFVDDADEITPLEFEFVKYLKPQLKEAFVSCDEFGCSRYGFLAGDVKTSEKLFGLFDEKPVLVESDSPLKFEAEAIFSAILSGSEMKSKNLSNEAFNLRYEMIENATKKIKELVEHGVAVDDIAIVTPVFDSLLKASLSQFFDKERFAYEFLSGQEKLIEDPLVKAYIATLKISLDVKLGLSELKNLLMCFSRLPLKYLSSVINGYNQSLEFIDFRFEVEGFQKKYETFKELLNSVKNDTLSLSEKVSLIEKNTQIFNEKTEFFFKQIKDFDNVFADSKLSKDFQQKIIVQLENSIIAENPIKEALDKVNKIFVSTPQKLIDNEIFCRYQIWLDISSDEWVKEDIGPLYNSWVFNKGYDKDSFVFEDNLECKKQKLARLLRKLVLCCNSQIIAYSSNYDSCAIENYGGILKYLNFGNYEYIPQKTVAQIIPREDQKAVLEYKRGAMAVTAVPGAGKTTILLALILGLVESGLNPENIFVLTYMDSAAKNFKDRIGMIIDERLNLPNISTIHGLALRIIKENDNHLKLNLDQDFEVIDDSQRQKIMRDIFSKLNLDFDLFDNFDKSISILKLSGKEVDYSTKNQELRKFFRFYELYVKTLSAQGLIDYDDMLTFAVKLLEGNSDILQYYQNKCQYLIEDEAQDSSCIQQKLINLLAGKHRNIVRCGDINQAITSTFTNSDLQGFKEFAKNNFNVKMVSQQRCSQAICNLANGIIEYSKGNEELKDSFFDIKMKPVFQVDEKPAPIEILSFTSHEDEKNYIASSINSKLKKEPNATFAVLLRNNYQVGEYSQWFTDRGFKIISKGDCLSQKPVFQLILNILKILDNPLDSVCLLELMKTFASRAIFSFSENDYQFVTNLSTPLILLKEKSLKSLALEQLWWEVSFWLSKSNLAYDELSQLIGLYYFSNKLDKSNLYIISAFIKRFSDTYAKTTDFLERLEVASNKPLKSGFKLLDEDGAFEDKKDLCGKLQIMTYHKSKGLEFDYVYLPELTNEQMPVKIDDAKLRAGSLFVESVKAFCEDGEMRKPQALKKAQIEENMRLLYVATTRARKFLSISVAEQYKVFNRLKKLEPSKIFDEYLNYY